MNNLLRKNLYRGTGYEYYVVSQLLIKEYEAYKLPVDFGFDLAACKPSDEIEYNKDREDDIYYFQVKSGVLKSNKEKNVPAGNRDDKSVIFRINKHQIEKIMNNHHAFLVCCLVEKIEDKKTKREIEQLKGIFCLGKAQIHHLKEEKYFIEKEKDYILEVVFSPQATLKEKCQNELNILKSKLKNDNKGLESLGKLKVLVDKADIINTNTNNNIYFLKDGNKHFLKYYFYGIDNFEKMDDAKASSPFFKAKDKEKYQAPYQCQK